MSKGPPVPFHKARRELKKEVAAEVEKLDAGGWVIYRSGHKFAVWCPCDDSHAILINSTPKSPAWHAKQIARQAAKCPDRHELMSSRLRR